MRQRGPFVTILAGVLVLLLIAVAVFPGAPFATIGSAAKATGNPNLAWKAYEQAIHVSGDHPSLSWLMATLDLGKSTGHEKEAFADGQSAATIIDRRITSAKDDGDKQKMLDQLERLLKFLLVMSDDGRIRVWLAQLELGHDPAEALLTLAPLIAKAVDARPQCGSVEAEAEGLYGLAKWRAGSLAEARDPLKLAVSLSRFQEIASLFDARSDSEQEYNNIDNEQAAQVQSLNQQGQAALNAELITHNNLVAQEGCDRRASPAGNDSSQVSVFGGCRGHGGVLALGLLALLFPEAELLGLAEEGAPGLAARGAVGGAPAEEGAAAAEGATEGGEARAEAETQVDAYEESRLKAVAQQYETSAQELVARYQARKVYLKSAIDSDDAKAADDAIYAGRDALDACAA